MDVFTISIFIIKDSMCINTMYKVWLSRDYQSITIIAVAFFIVLFCVLGVSTLKFDYSCSWYDLCIMSHIMFCYLHISDLAMT